MKPGAFSFPVRQELVTPALTRGVNVAPLMSPIWNGGAWVDPADNSRVLLLGGTTGQSWASAGSPYSMAWGSRWDAAAGQNVLFPDTTMSAGNTGPNMGVAMGLDGTLYAIGGLSQGTTLRALNLTTPASAAWSTKAALTSGMTLGCVACALADGRILICDCNASTVALLYTPGSPGSMASAAASPGLSNSAFGGGGAWLLPNGHVVIYNGTTTWADYDPGGNTWSSPTRVSLSSSMPPSRQVDAQGRIWFTKSKTLWWYSFASDVAYDTGIFVGDGIPCPLPDGRIVIFGARASAGSNYQGAQLGEPSAVQIVSA